MFKYLDLSVVNAAGASIALVSMCKSRQPNCLESPLSYVHAAQLPAILRPYKHTWTLTPTSSTVVACSRARCYIQLPGTANWLSSKSS